MLFDHFTLSHDVECVRDLSHAVDGLPRFDYD